MYILMFSSVITLVLTLSQLYKDYRYDLYLIDGRFQQIADSNLASINESVWTFNETTLNLQLKGLQRLPDIAYLEVVAPDNRIIAKSGDHQTRNIITHEFPLEYDYLGQKQNLGKLVAVASLENVYQRLLDTAIVILITQAIKTFLVSLFTIVIFQTLITRHLGKFTEYLKRLNIRAPFRPYHLERKENALTHKDELDQLVSSFNVMHANLHQTYAQLALNQDVLKTAQNMANMGSCIWNIETGKVESFESLALVLGAAPDQAELQSLPGILSFVHPDDRTLADNLLQDAKDNCKSVSGVFRIIRKDGEHRYIELQARQWVQNETAGTILICNWLDITADTLQKQRLGIMANYDALTGLPNRALFQEKAQQAIDANRPFMMLLIDLDGFKDINDSIGHHAGDELLQELNPRLTQVIGEGDIVARLGGDEFALILCSPPGMEAALEMVARIRDAISLPLHLEELQVQVEASVGISLFPEHSHDVSSLMRYADVAMYQAKSQHVGYQIYDPANDPNSQRRLSLISDIRNAINTSQLMLYYQPKMDMTTQAVVGLEALARWTHPTYGFVPPSDFIPFVERTQLIQPFTLWAIEHAMQQQKQLASSGCNLVISVNISARNLKDANFSASVKKILDKVDVSASCLMLEITESAIMEDRNAVMHTIMALASEGIALSVDDFGTGYSSLAYLKILPVRELKIDRSFVIDMLKDENDAIIVKSTIDLAHNLGMYVTAEGVENADILQGLSAMHCDVAQGYLFSPPMPYDTLTQWLSDKKCG